MMYEKISIANARNRVALDVLSYHATSCASKANKLMVSWKRSRREEEEKRQRDKEEKLGGGGESWEL